jgi:hypothetical protein
MGRWTGAGLGRRRVAIVGVALALVAVACHAVSNDYTGDRTSDLVWRDPLSGYWYEVGQSAPIWQDEHWDETDIPAAADYNGDGKVDPAVVRGTMWMSSAFANPVVFDPAGMPLGPAATPSGAPGGPALTLVPVPGDYDGTGKDVPAFYDQVDATWWISTHTGSVQFGIPPTQGGSQGYDVPVPADYDGDGKTDIAVFRPPDGTFHYLSSKTGQEVTLPSVSVNYRPGYEPVPADYDGVGHAEPAVTGGIGAAGPLYVAGHANSIGGLSVPASLGPQTVLPMLGDYDGDGKIDPAIFAYEQWGNQPGQQAVEFKAETASFTMILDTTAPLTYDPGQNVELPPGIATGWQHVKYYGLCLTSPYYC